MQPDPSPFTPTTSTALNKMQNTIPQDSRGTLVQIENINGVASLEINLELPGVYVARGPNGAGKTSAIEAFRAACGDPNARAEASDGQAKGSVRCGGVMLAVGHRRKVTGATDVRLVNHGALGRLIDPQIKDSELAAKARLRALVELFPLPADDDARNELAQGDAEIFDWLSRTPSNDALEVAEAVRKRANELGNEQEKLADKYAGEESSLTSMVLNLGQLDLAAGDLGQARAEAERLLREADRAAVAAKARIELETTQAQLRTTVGDRPDPGASLLKIEELKTTIEQRERELLQFRGELKTEVDSAHRLTQARSQWDRQAEILSRKPEGPTPDEAKTAAELAAAAKLKEERARVLATAIDYQRKASDAKRARESATDRAEKLRAIAKRTAIGLGNLLQRRGVPGVTVEDGRLMAATPEGLKDFDLRLSFGQRVRVALAIALAAVPSGEEMPVLPLDPVFWLALDRDRRLEVCQAAQERNVCLVTEEPDIGPLRVERMQAA